MQSRRDFLGDLAAPVLGGIATSALLNADAFAVLAELAATPGDPASIARDESFWFAAQQAFTVDRSVVNLNNGGVSPSPRVVQEAMKRHLDFSNTSPPAYALWQVLEPQREGVRQRLARLFGTDTEEIAIVRNASEGLQSLQLGIDFRRGDEILTTTLDYPRMITTWQQRERRDGIVLKQIELPVPAEDPAEVVRRFAAGLTPKTRLVLMSHVVFLNGQILPVRDVVQTCRRQGIPVIVDAAHSFAQFPFTRDELDCDFLATSLHKWLFAPHGTGMLCVRRERIKEIWPLMAAPTTLDGDIRKFEEIGTHPAANFLAIGDALTFHEGLGAARKAARLRYLKERWANALLATDRAKLHTSLDPRFSCGIANVEIEGVETGALVAHLWSRHKILVTPIKHAQFEGMRVTPSVYTTLEELDRFVEAVTDVIHNGLPKA